MVFLHLERVEMIGFKSFADKTVIEFDKGVTAIVGPNGSGKSNLSEAIRWVLGEQSAKNLRGMKMNDIVFSGSDSRKPVNIAEVTLVLNNEDRTLPIDFTEVSLTRRINRNGETECFINRKPCRLKDLTDLLMDSGIGKDSFSLISQGKVEKIFQSKPEERRFIFEEAAGVAKYKTRKLGAERKLNETREHLNRVEDILHEIKDQMDPLETQQKIAKIYQEKSSQLSEIEVALLASEINVLNQEWQKSKAQIDVFQKKVIQEEKEQTELQDDLALLKHQLSLYEQKLQTLQTNYIDTIQKIEQLEGQKNVLMQKTAFSEKNQEEQEYLLAEKQANIKKETDKMIAFKKQINEKQTNYEQLQAVINDLEKQKTQLLDDNNFSLQEVRDHYIDKLQEQSVNKNTIQQLEREKEIISEKLSSVVSKLSDLRDSIANSKEEMRQYQDERIKKTVALKEKQEELNAIVLSLAQAERERVAYDKNITDVLRTIHQAEARRESQQELTDSYASYYQGVKEVLKRKKHLPGIYGPIGELFQVSETYTLAIDTALGGAIQSIVVNHPQTAAKAIQMLKTNRLGRATFLPLSVIQGKQIPNNLKEKLNKQEGFMGLASELIEYDDIYSNVATNLLGTTIISQDLKTGLVLSKFLNNRYRVVSLEGDVIHAGGSMTGGASKNQQGNSVFNRKNTIIKLTKSIEENTHLYEDMKAKKQALLANDRETLEQKDGLQEEIRQLQFEIDKNQEDLENNKKRILEFEDKQAVYLFDKEEYQKNLLEFNDMLAKELGKKESLVTELEVIKKDMAKLSLSEEERQTLLESIQTDLSINQQQFAVLKEQLKQLKNTVRANRDWIEKETQVIQRLQKMLESNNLEETTNRQLTSKLLEALKISASQKEQLNQELSDIREKKHSLEEETETKNNQLRKLTISIQDTLEKLSKLKSESGRQESSIDHHLNRLSETYGLSYEAAIAKFKLTLSVEEAKQIVSQLKQEIVNLGPVNIAAIGEYERISERFTFLSQQQADLMEARRSLLGTMEEMDAEVSKRFLITFNAIKKQFEKTFPKLFGGGKATIVMSEQDNILETGIDIIAQPPGKKLEQLSLLSGGEKAFTAIALLFAIIEVSPVPFCVLDEVEAALDETNVTRFGKYLASFENQTQFIVITHRKGTMEEADVLYGVTMQDSGVSRLASVKFAENQEEEIK